MQAILGIMILVNCHLFTQQVSFKIEINNLKSSDGSIIVSVFKDQKSFKDEEPMKRVVISKKGNMINKTFKTDLTLPPGTYGIAVVDDENNDGKMNFNWMGIPKEGFGFSDYYHTGLSRPVFSDFSFDLAERRGVMNIKMKYM